MVPLNLALRAIFMQHRGTGRQNPVGLRGVR